MEMPLHDFMRVRIERGARPLDGRVQVGGRSLFDSAHENS